MAAGEDMEVESPAGDIEIVDVEKDAKRFVFIIFTKFSTVGLCCEMKRPWKLGHVTKRCESKMTENVNLFASLFFSKWMQICYKICETDCKLTLKYGKKLCNQFWNKLFHELLMKLLK